MLVTDLQLPQVVGSSDQADRSVEKLGSGKQEQRRNRAAVCRRCEDRVAAE